MRCEVRVWIWIVWGGSYYLKTGENPRLTRSLNNFGTLCDLL